MVTSRIVRIDRDSTAGESVARYLRRLEDDNPGQYTLLAVIPSYLTNMAIFAVELILDLKES